MDRNMYDYEHKLLKELESTKFSFKKVITILKLNAIAGHVA